MRGFLRIVLLCIAAAVAYGLIHDQITIRISPEYFTVLHPRILPEDFPLTGLALAWGVLATWWVGLILGIILGMACCAGKRPKLSARDMLRPIGVLLLIMAAGAALSGWTGYELMSYHLIEPSTYIVETVQPGHITGVIIDGFTHMASYALGFAGGIVISFRALIQRGKLVRKAITNQGTSGSAR